MILDSSFLLDLFSGDRSAFERGQSLQNEDVVQRVPAPAIMELQYGVSMTGSDEELRNLENAFRLYPIVRFDEALAREAGTLLARADRDASGESGVEKVDAQIAAVASVREEPVLTSNIADFEKLGVDVETY